MQTLDVNQTDFDEKVLAASFCQPVVIDFWAPCRVSYKSFKHMLEKLARLLN